MNAQKILTEARKLVENPDNWLQGKGADTGICGKRYCAQYAILRAARLDLPDDPYNLYRAEALHLMASETGDPIFKWNDERGRKHPEVLAAFDRAIAAASSRSPQQGEQP